MAKTSPKGVQLLLGDGATPTEAFTAVAQLKELGNVSITPETADATDHDSVVSGVAWAEHLETITRLGDIAISGHWDQAQATHDETTGLISKASTAGPHNFQIIWPDVGATQVDFAATLSISFGASPVDGGAIPFEGTLKPSGAFTWS